PELVLRKEHAARDRKRAGPFILNLVLAALVLGAAALPQLVEESFNPWLTGPAAVVGPFRRAAGGNPSSSGVQGMPHRLGAQAPVEGDTSNRLPRPQCRTAGPRFRALGTVIQVVLRPGAPAVRAPICNVSRQGMGLWFLEPLAPGTALALLLP